MVRDGVRQLREALTAEQRTLTLETDLCQIAATRARIDKIKAALVDYHRIEFICARAALERAAQRLTAAEHGYIEIKARYQVGDLVEIGGRTAQIVGRGVLQGSCLEVYYEVQYASRSDPARLEKTTHLFFEENIDHEV